MRDKVGWGCGQFYYGHEIHFLAYFAYNNWRIVKHAMLLAL